MWRSRKPGVAGRSHGKLGHRRRFRGRYHPARHRDRQRQCRRGEHQTSILPAVPTTSTLRRSVRTPRDYRLDRGTIRCSIPSIRASSTLTPRRPQHDHGPRHRLLANTITVTGTLVIVGPVVLAAFKTINFFIFNEYLASLPARERHVQRHSFQQHWQPSSSTAATRSGASPGDTLASPPVAARCLLRGTGKRRRRFCYHRRRESRSRSATTISKASRRSLVPASTSR